jgi:hypothetical protein
VPKAPIKKSDFLGKIGFLKPCPRCPSRNPIFGKNRISIDFHKNNFTLSDPSPKIPYLKWARVRLNRVKVLAFIYLKPKIFGITKELSFLNVYKTVPKVPIKKSDFWEKSDF